MGFAGPKHAAKNPIITNFSVPTASTEVSHVLQSNLKMIMIRVRGLAKLQFSFIPTESFTKFITIPAGVTYHQEGLLLSGKTLHFQLNLAPNTVEILEWT